MMSNKNYIVAGGSSGIGLALTKLLAEQNEVYVLSRTGESLQSLTGVTHLPIDITQDDIPTDQLPDVIHGVVYCPGSISLKPFRSLKPDQFRQDFEINLIGAVKVIQAALKGMKKSEGAGVVLFSTVAVGQGMAFHASIAAAKGAVEGLTRSLAAELAPKVRVNCVAPSLTNTPLAEKLLSTPEKMEASANRHPLKRVGSAEEMAAIAEFLLSEKGSWITGQILGVDGGLSRLR